MQALKYDGHVYNGQFIPKDLPIRLNGRFKAVLTVLDAPDTKGENLISDPLERPGANNTKIFSGIDDLEPLEVCNFNTYQREDFYDR